MDLSPVCDVELWAGAGSTKPFVCQGCAEQPTLVPGTVPGCSVLLEKMLLVSHLENETAHSTGQGAKIIMG